MWKAVDQSIVGAVTVIPGDAVDRLVSEIEWHGSEEEAELVVWRHAGRYQCRCRRSSGCHRRRLERHEKKTRWCSLLF